MKYSPFFKVFPLRPLRLCGGLNRYNKTIHEYLHASLDLFYPRFCLHCNINLNNSLEQYLCTGCKESITYVNENYCIKCGTILGPYITSSATDGCFFCKGKNFHFDTITAIAHYDDIMKTLIHKYKYAGQKFLHKTFNELALQKTKTAGIADKTDVIIPVPLHWLRKLQRGFNQSELLARGLHRSYCKPLSINNLLRVRNTMSQTKLSKNKRQQNIHNAFYIRDPESIKGKRILLVDDVYTTGVTSEECANFLKKAGAQSVHIFVLAISDYHR